MYIRNIFAELLTGRIVRGQDGASLEIKNQDDKCILGTSDKEEKVVGVMSTCRVEPPFVACHSPSFIKH